MTWPRGALFMLAVAAIAATTASDLAAGSSADDTRAARRRWALARMDEMANEALRCRQRFQKKREVEACEAEFTRKFRQYNEMYLEASRE
jgi:hypothetical protein